MSGDEIRKLSAVAIKAVSLNQNADSKSLDGFAFQALCEVAAQLAELNEQLKVITKRFQ